MEWIGTIGSFILGSPDWGGVVAVILILFGLVLLWSLRFTPLGHRSGWGLFALKATAIGLLAVCLLDPLLARSRVKPGENIVLLLADDSASMSVRMSTDSPHSRGEWLRELLTDPESDWQTRLAQDFDVRRYAFASSLSRVESFETLEFTDPASNLNATLDSLTARFQNQPLAAVVLFSDGNSTDAVKQARQLGVPIYPVWFESPEPVSDLALGKLSVSQTNFEDAPVTVQTQVLSSGSHAGPVSVTLEHVEAFSDEKTETTDHSHQEQNAKEATPVASQTVSFQNGNETEQRVRFEISPPRPGVNFYRLKLEQTSQGKSAPEATLANNERLVAVNRDSHVSRILYVAGRPNWERKFLGRALEEDQQLQLVSLIRIARKEARFDFRGRAGDSSNSLFRGFQDAADEETEAYDQPVLTRLNTRDQKELSDGFPKQAEDLFVYDAVILDDVESAFFTHDQLTLIDQFVSDRGGGLLMLGGRDTFQHGDWDNTPVAAALPVYLSTSAPGPTQNLRWSLTRDGWLEPWMRVRNTEQAEQNWLASAPELQVRNDLSEAKPGARVFATVTDQNGQTGPALIAQQYGQGRSAALLVGDLWKWFLQRDETQPHDAEKFWRQTTRWLVGDVPRRLEASVEPLRTSGMPAFTLQVRVRDRLMQPEDGARAEISVRQPDGSQVPVTAQPSLREPGLFEAVHVSRQPGAYVARVSVPASKEDPSRSLELGWTSNPLAEEFQHSRFRRETLEELASATGGRIVPHDELPNFVAELPQRQAPVMETATSQLWHRPWLLGIVILLLAAEWGLRRWKGLA